jgi:hypothetical protein
MFYIQVIVAAFVEGEVEVAEAEEVLEDLHKIKDQYVSY